MIKREGRFSARLILVFWRSLYAIFKLPFICALLIITPPAPCVVNVVPSLAQ